ncbi:transposase [Micromonospora gifhornensis]|uniref:transposase n=1 Tax=Micromonospora gifhornensis TaxID=84594 RepID=UPI0034521A2B
MGTPKTRTGPVEASENTPTQLTKLSTAVLVNRCAALTIGSTQPHDPEQATAALVGLARRAGILTEEIITHDRQLAPLVRQAAPHNSALFGVGTDVAAQLLTTAGDNPDRLRSEAALVHLCDATSIPASSGRMRCHRLHRGGARDANHALPHHRPLPPTLRPTYPRLPATTHHPKASASKKSSTASSATSSATSTPPYRPTSLTSPLDLHRSIEMAAALGRGEASPLHVSALMELSSLVEG